MRNLIKIIITSVFCLLFGAAKSQHLTGEAQVFTRTGYDYTFSDDGPYPDGLSWEILNGSPSSPTFTLNSLGVWVGSVTVTWPLEGVGEVRVINPATKGIVEKIDVTISCRTPIVEINAPDSGAPGELITLAASGSNITSYSWNGPGLVSSSGQTVGANLPTVETNPPSVIYSVTAYNGTCSAAASATVLVNFLDPGPGRTYCKNSDPVNLADWGLSLDLGSWEGPSIAENHVVISQLASGEDHLYTYTRTATGLQATLVVTVAEVQTGSLSVSPESSCNFKGSISLVGTSNTINDWEKFSDDENRWISLNANTNPLLYSEAEPVSFRALVKQGECTAPTTPIQITAMAAQTGQIKTDNLVATCENVTASLSVEGTEGTVEVWQYSTDKGNTWPGSLSQSIWEFSSAQPTHVRAGIRYDGCPLIYTPAVEFRPLNPVGGFLSDSNVSTTCGRTTGKLELVGAEGETYTWQSSLDGERWDPFPVTDNTFDFDVSNETHFRVKVENTSAGCSEKYSSVFSAYTATRGGEAKSSSTEQCGTASGNVFITNFTGAILKWEHSTDGISWDDLTNSDGRTTMAYPPTSAPMNHYRALVRLEGCASEYSESVKISVAPPTVPGLVRFAGEDRDAEEGPNGLIFYPVFELLENSYNGLIQKWHKYEESANGDVRHSVLPETSRTIYPVLTETGGFRAEVKSGACDALLSGQATFVINSPFLGVKEVFGHEVVGNYEGYSYEVHSVEGVSLQDGFTFIANSGQGFFILLDDNYALPPVDQNYVKEEVIREEGLDEDDIYFANPQQRQSVFTYVDGLGRPSQQVLRWGNPEEKDVVTPITYDPFGRIDREYLPYVAEAKDGMFKEDALTKQAAFYLNAPAKVAASDYPYAVKILEKSPLGRVLAQGAPGSDWQPGPPPNELVGRTLKFRYETNLSSEARIWSIDAATQKPVSGSYYPPGELFVNITIDEHDNQVREYKNKQGLVVLKRAQNGAEWVETCYIYDNFNLLRFVIQPEGMAQNVQEPDEDFLNSWVFQYRYDERQRMVEKRVPGSGWTYLVYDRRDRLVMTQDANQQAAKEWTFTKYDALNRPVVTGIHTFHDPAEPARIAGREEISGLISTSDFVETYDGSADFFGYTNNVFPTESLEMMTVTYYDNDRFSQELGELFTYKPEALDGLPAEAFPRTKGLVTGQQIRIIGTDTFLKSTTWYDKRYRPIQTLSENNVGGFDRVSTRFDFEGKVMAQSTKHSSADNPEVTILEEFIYNHTGQLISHFHQVDNGRKVLLTDQQYNAIGQLVEKNLHHKAEGAYHQSVDYRYNIRGWLTHINNAALESDGGATNDDGDDYFGFELKYNNATLSATEAQYNGNISEALWKSVGSNKQAYRYSYDPLNRLNEASYVDLGNPLNNGKFDEIINAYDRNGNIKQLQRRNSLTGFMDDLTYDYTGMGNQLRGVSDTGDKSAGFKDGEHSGDDYAYDANGNMKADQNKGIEVAYNFLNLPQAVTKGDEHIQYVYAANGVKLQQVVNAAGETEPKITDYAGAFIYENSNLKFIQHAEGRTLIKDGTPAYEYFLKDHLGNVRLSFTTTQETEEAKATMEASNETEERGQFLRYDNVRRIYSRLLDHTQDDINGEGYAFRLSGGPEEQEGVARSLQVHPGDKVHMEVYAKYIHPDDQANPELLAIQQVMTAIAGATSPLMLEGTAYGTTQNALPFDLETGAPGDENEDYTGPQAYLNYVFLPLDFDLTRMGLQAVKMTDVARETGTNVPHELLELDFTATEPGYLYVFVSNDREEVVEEVFFDDLKVVHEKGPIVQVDDYYPFGLAFNSYSSGLKNDYLYNDGAERQDELDLNVDFTLFRMYDPAIGRWWQVDPKADLEELVSWSPYNYSYNNPIRWNDPLGDCPPCGLVKQEVERTLAPVKEGIEQGMAKAEKAVEAVGNFFSGLFKEGNGDTQKGGITLTTNENAVDPSKSTATNNEPEINADALLAAMGGAGAGKLNSGTASESVAEGVGKVKDLVNEFAKGTTSTENSSGSSTSTSGSNQTNASDQVTGTDTTWYIPRLTPTGGVQDYRVTYHRKDKNDSTGNIQTNRLKNK